MIDRRVTALDERGGNQGHAAAYQIDGNNVETLIFIGWKLAKESAQQIGKRRGSIDSFVPSEEGFFERRFDNRRAHDRNRQSLAAFCDQRFSEALGQRIRVRPAQFLRAACSGFGEISLQPADAILTNLIVECGPVQIFRGVLFGLRLHPQACGHFVALSPRLRLRDHVLQRAPFRLGIEVCKSARIVVGREFFSDATILLACDVAGGKMQKPRVVRSLDEFKNVHRRISIRNQRVAQIRIEIRQP